MSTDFLFDYANLAYAENGNAADVNRINWRCELLLTRNQDYIKGKRILDLACSNGKLSYPCLALGAEKVTGVEVRQERIDKGKEYIAQTAYVDKMSFVNADSFDYLASVQPGDVDTILCFGFLYHTVRQVDFFREIQRIAPETVIIDTGVARNYLWYGRSLFSNPKLPCLLMVYEDPKLGRNTIDSDGIAFWPTKSFLQTMFDSITYSWKQIVYSKKEIKDWSAMNDYRKEYFVSYIAHPK